LKKRDIERADKETKGCKRKQKITASETEPEEFKEVI
jgi:hypothetical protein